MKTKTRGIIGRIVAGLLAGASLLLVSGCNHVANSSPTVISAQTAAQAPGAPGQGQPVFDSDDQVAGTLLAAVKAQDHEQVHHLLGPAWKELVSGDKVQDAGAFKEFADRAAEQTRLEKHPGEASILHVGKDDWAFPIPIARTSEGKWFLDTEGGKEEILARRIGKNELEAIKICRIYVNAQREYASQPRDDSDVLKYAERILSTPGKMDGLYWNVPAGGEQSPFGRLIAQEKLEGYQPAPGQHEPYHGYRFRVLKQQGAAASGGKYSYIINGNMVAGFALIAYPVDYESSGIMTFIVNQRGKVFQKDMGANTPEIARHVTEYSPDSSWKLVKD
jgi:hypothetical protein